MHARQQKDVVLEKIDHLIKVNLLEFIFLLQIVIDTKSRYLSY